MTAPLNPNKKHRTMKKAVKRLKARQDAFDAMKDTKPNGSQYHRPGSTKK